jgi:hypothetical protein
MLVRDDRLVAGVAAAASLAQGARLAQWRTLSTRAQPIVWVLHIAYAWLPVGLALKAVTLLEGRAIAEFWLHALTIGAVTSMILGMMTRAALGYTGRPLVVDPLDHGRLRPHFDCCPHAGICTRCVRDRLSGRHRRKRVDVDRHVCAVRVDLCTHSVASKSGRPAWLRRHGNTPPHPPRLIPMRPQAAVRETWLRAQVPVFVIAQRSSRCNRVLVISFGCWCLHWSRLCG